MKNSLEILIVEGESAMGKPEFNRRPIGGIKLYHISNRNRKWYHPASIWNDACKLFWKALSLLKRKGG